MDILRASAYAEPGKKEEAISIISNLVQSYLQFPYRNRIARRVQSNDDLSGLLANLYRPGLPEA